jgi:hypothetical protein
MIKAIYSIFILTLLLGTAGAQEPVVSLKRYDVVRVKLEHPLVRVQADGQKQSTQEAFLVRLWGTFPSARAQRVKLFLGDEAVEEYGGLEGGLYFWVWDEARLRELTGRELRFGWGEEAVRASGVLFEPLRWAPWKTVTEAEAF